MSVTTSEVLALLKGDRSAELRARFLNEAAQPEGELFNMLKAVETWAQSNLNPNSPSPLSPRYADSSDATVTVLKRAALWNDKEDQPKEESELKKSAVTKKDVVAIIQGKASPETIAKVKKALDEASSDLSTLLKRMESGAD